MNVLGKEVEVLNSIKEIIQLLNQVQDAKARNDDIGDRLKLIREEKTLIIEYISKIELLHSILRELYSRRTTSVFDKEVTVLMQNLIEVVRDLQEYANILEQETKSGLLNIPGENNALLKLGKALNLESVECHELLRKLERHGGNQEITIYRRIKSILNKFKEGWFNFRFFQLKPTVNLCLSVALFGAIACGDEIVVEAPRDTQIEQREQIVEQVNEVVLDEFIGFRPRNVLIYCANENEKIGVIQTLKNRNKLRKSSAKFTIKSENGISVIDDWSVKNPNGKMEQIRINIVVDGQRIPQVSGGYQLITLRGHTQDMMPLYEDAKAYEANKVLYILGGCKSVQFIPQIIKSNKAVIADNYIGESANNTYILIRVIDLSRKVDSWESLSETILSNSDRAELRTYFPEMEYTMQLLNP